jgi:hypothetical protein
LGVSDALEPNARMAPPARTAGRTSLSERMRKEVNALTDVDQRYRREVATS